MLVVTKAGEEIEANLISFEDIFLIIYLTNTIIQIREVEIAQVDYIKQSK